MFSAAGVSADPDKIQHIVQVGWPDHLEDKSYEEVTAPLRRLLIGSGRRTW